MSTPTDTAALRARLREYDPAVPRCNQRITRALNCAPDYTPEYDRALWDMVTYVPCCRPERHEGECRNTRLVMGWPGFATVTSLLDEVERLRAEVSYLRACVPPTRPTDYGHEVWTAALRAEVRAERAAVLAWLREVATRQPPPAYTVSWCADRIARGDHRRKEEP